MYKYYSLELVIVLEDYRVTRPLIDTWTAFVEHCPLPFSQGEKTDARAKIDTNLLWLLGSLIYKRHPFSVLNFVQKVSAKAKEWVQARPACGKWTGTRACKWAGTRACKWASVQMSGKTMKWLSWDYRRVFFPPGHCAIFCFWVKDRKHTHPTSYTLKNNCSEFKGQVALNMMTKPTAGRGYFNQCVFH